MLQQACQRFFFNDTAPTEIYTLSLHDALPILRQHQEVIASLEAGDAAVTAGGVYGTITSVDEDTLAVEVARSEEHTSELHSRQYHVCRYLLYKNQMHQQACQRQLLFYKQPGPR